MTAQLPPAPPTRLPSPPPTFIDVDGTLKWATYAASRRKFNAMVASNPHTALPNEVAVPVTWTLKVGSRTVKRVFQSWNETDKLVLRLPVKKLTRTYRIRVLKDGHKVFDKRYPVRARQHERP